MQFPAGANRWGIPFVISKNAANRLSAPFPNPKTFAFR
jgi:hypothetical protein